MRERSIAICVLACIGCGPPPRQGGGGDDTGADSNTGGGGDGNNGCAQGTEFVYTIDQFSDKLSQFDPSTKTFTDLGSLACPTMPGATPFSMSVDRNAVAWVLYNSGELFQVQITNGLACAKSAWHSQSGLTVFGMGFSTDQAGGQTEHLFIGGGASQTQASFTLASVDPTTLVATPIGSEPHLPEMTGTGNAELWGFFPGDASSQVVQFDKTTGAALKTYDEPALSGASMAGYAFAHWGGDYWVFLIRSTDPSTVVFQVDGMMGTIKSTTPTTGRTVVGAGVSTCAPVVIE
jgi:hypothetical protein